MKEAARQFARRHWHQVPDPIRRGIERARLTRRRYYSPFPDLDELRIRGPALFEPRDAFAGIDMRAQAQLDLVAKLNKATVDLPFGDVAVEGLRYRYDNGKYAHGDGAFTAGMLRHLAPRRYFEIGSGWSTLLALDVADLWVHEMEITAVDPFPDALVGLLDGESPRRLQIERRPAQQLAAADVSELGAGDVLFVDSTHVSKTGSDVNHIIFELLPALTSGVYVHFHDVWGNFEYPKEWVFQGRAWSEAYLLRAFLQFNSEFEVVLATEWIWQHHRGSLGPGFAPAFVNPGASLWLRRR